ncbi:MAG: 3-phosphoshikimate 1-carboxyvinyltransferase [Paraprevotella sp.]|nr:3-phosphoshikimate 1-carboxyvinyltransferase [Paraprevotella sp.]
MLLFAPEKLHRCITLPASKSISNRALIIRALSGSQLPIENISPCDDSVVVVDALRNMPHTIDIKAAGTAMRFLTSLLATTSGEHIITGTERMCHRPISILVDALRNIGAEIEYQATEGYPPLKISGKPLRGGNLSLPGNVSSQYISSLLMIAPTLQHGLTLTLTGEVISRPYIDMTMAIMQQFGATAQWISDKEICVKPVPYSPIPYYIEGDWSAASYWYEMVALSGDSNAELILPGLFRDSLQGDAEVARIFEPLGVGTKYEGNSVRLFKTGSVANVLDLDMRNQPDLAQTIVVTCCMSGIPFRISGLQTLRIKETDRIDALQKELSKLGISIGVEGDDAVHWDGRTSSTPDNTIGIDTYEDHRMAMAFAPVALKKGSIIINNPQVVSKSYPSYWDDLRQAGFKLQ